MFQRTSCMHIWANQSAIDRPGGQSGGSMCMVQHMATTLIGGRARACGWNWKGQIKYSIFPKGANQRTFLPIRARIDWYIGLYIYMHAHVQRTHVRMHMKGQIKCTNFMPGANQNARNPSQKCAWKWFGRIFWGFLEKINTTCTRWYRCQTIWNRNNKKPQNSN